VNFVHTSGWNAGAWGFNVSNNQYSGGSDWFGVNRASGFDSDSRGSSYMEVNVAYEFVPTWTANLHLAKTDIKTILGGRSLNYNDGLIGVGKTFGQGWNTSLSYVKASYQDATAWWKPSGGYGSLANSDTLVNSGQGRLIFSLGRVY
jgi:hypothetical protein